MSNGISIVIPSTGNLDNLQRLLPSILDQNVEAIELQVIVVLNGIPQNRMTDINERISKAWPTVELLRIEGKGVNLARNSGLRCSKYDFVLFLDDDCELHNKKTLKNYLKLHHSNPDYFAIGGGYILPARHGLFDEVYNYIQMNWFLHGQKESGKALVNTQYLLGGNFCLKRHLATAHQLQFEPSIQYGGSELDFFRQASSVGLKLGAIEMDVTHNTNESFYSVGKKVFKQGRGKYFIDAKFGKDQANSHSSDSKFSVLRRLYSYWFWLGYYGAAGKSWKVFFHMLRDFVGFVDVMRFKILKKLNR